MPANLIKNATAKNTWEKWKMKKMPKKHLEYKSEVYGNNWAAIQCAFARCL